MQRTCSKCGQTKDITEFCPDKRRPLGITSHCRACHRAYYTKRQVAQPLGPTDSKRCTKCGEVKPVAEFRPDPRLRTKYKSYCKACGHQMANIWKRAHKDERRAYEASRIDELREIRRAWRVKNKDRVAELRRKHDNSPRGRMVNRLNHSRRRAVGKAGDVTTEQLEHLHATQLTCAYCRRRFTARLKATMDHVIPLVKGGPHTISNIVLACQSCNSRKRDQVRHLI